MKKVNLLLVVIILLAAVLRLWNFGGVPSSPDWDEAALGYNAYSIIQTGKDEYGRFFPVVLQSFADYKPAFYMYLTIPPVLILGLNTFAVRLPSAIFGILTVLAVYFLVKELFPRHKTKDLGLKTSEESTPYLLRLTSYVPIVSSGLLAISPWHIQFSRIAFETNVGLAFNIFAALFFLKGLKKPWFLSLSTVCAALSIHVYQSEKVFVPLLFAVLIVIYGKNLFAVPKKYLFSAVAIGFLVLLPVIHYLFTDAHGLDRAKGVLIFTQETKNTEREKKNYLDDKTNNRDLNVFLHNSRIAYGREVIYGYLSHYDLRWLFVKGDLERHHAPNMSLLYIWELPFLLIGIYILLFGRFPRKTKLLIFFWFLITPIPASVTFGLPHSVRTLNFLPTFQIFIALGLLAALYQVSKIKYQIVYIKIKYLLFVLFFSFVMFNFLYYLNQYFVQQNYFYSIHWQYGYEEAVPYVQKIEKNYKKIVVSSEAPMDQSYMFFLFYMKYPPQQYHKIQDKIDGLSGNFEDKHAFDKYEFRPIDWDKEEKTKDILYIGRQDDFPNGIGTIKQINYLNGEPAILMVNR